MILTDHMYIVSKTIFDVFYIYIFFIFLGRYGFVTVFYNVHSTLNPPDDVRIYIVLVRNGKSDLAKLHARLDADFAVLFNRELSPENRFFVELKMGPDVLHHACHQATEMVKIGSTQLTLEMLRNFRQGFSLCEGAMAAALSLFADRDAIVASSHKDVNCNKNHYEPYRRSVYLSVEFFRQLSSAPQNMEAIKEAYFGADWQVGLTEYMFILAEESRNQNDWVLLLAEVSTRKIVYLNPARKPDDPFTVPELAKCTEMQHILQPFLQSVVPEEGQWICRPITNRVFSPRVERSVDSGMYVIALIYFFSCRVPVYFSQEAIEKLRWSFPYWLLAGKLPY